MRKDRKKVYDNKYNFDPGRLRNKVQFYQLYTASDSMGGASVTKTLVSTVSGAKEPVSINSMSQLNQLGIIAGASEFSQYYYLTIRYRSDFYPTKSMVVDIDGVEHKIVGVLAMDSPRTYIKLLCAVSK